jgi:type IV secretory pathway component VirB8
MGIFHSKPHPYHTDPYTFATEVNSASSSPVNQEEALVEYQAYDYIIVGGGELDDGSSQA